MTAESDSDGLESGAPLGFVGERAKTTPRPSGLIQERLGDAFFEPLPQDELARWYGDAPSTDA